MEGGTLFNPGFLGANFLWWVGQIADDSTWRDNNLPGKFESPQSIPGWGKRYKVRIIGLHDKEETEIPSDQLPWAQVMYPITAGGGQANASQTPNLRHGMFVFGFFLDGQEQQVPVIMGVLGNNAQTKLGKEIGTDNANFGPISGFAEGKVPPKGPAKPVPPDFGKTATAVSNSSTPISNPTIEHPDAHQLSVADVKREEKYQEKIPLMKPDNKIGSAIKCIQTVLDNLTKKIDKYLKSIGNYIDAATTIYNTINDVLNGIKNVACEIAKYIKLILDKIMEYLLKVLNKALTKVVSAMPASLRHLFADIKELLVELIMCLLNKLTQNLCDIINSLLNDIIKPKELDEKVRSSRGPCPGNNGDLTSPDVPICSAQNLVALTLKSQQKVIEDELQKIDNVLTTSLKDLQGKLAPTSSQTLGSSNIPSIPGVSIPDLAGLVGNITTSISSALSFENLKLSIFGCELSPNIALSDFYTLARGGSGQPESQTPNANDISNAVQTTPTPNVNVPEPVPFLDIRQNEPNLNFDTSDARTPDAIARETGQFA